MDEINTYPEFLTVGATALLTERLKLGLISEIKMWRQGYGAACNTLYRKEMNNILQFIDDVSKRLVRPIKDLDDIRFVMATLKELRQNEIRIDMIIGPIEESYSMLVKNEIELNHEEVERCDTLRYNWNRLMQLSSDTSSNLVELQYIFKNELLENVKDFAHETKNYHKEYSRVSCLWAFNFLFTIRAIAFSYGAGLVIILESQFCFSSPRLYQILGRLASVYNQN
jgi:dynein heavy chain